MHIDYLLKGRQRSVMLIMLLFMAVATFAVPASSDAEVLLYEGLSKYTEGGDGTQAIANLQRSFLGKPLMLTQMVVA